MGIPGDWHVAVGEELRQLLVKCVRRSPSIKKILEGNNRALLSISIYPPIVSQDNCNTLILAHDSSQVIPPDKTARDLLDYMEFHGIPGGELQHLLKDPAIRIYDYRP